MLQGMDSIRSCLGGSEGAESRYETPPASELQRLMWTKPGTSDHMDEVQPRIYIGDMYAAKDKRTLRTHHITHVLNAADGKFNVNTAKFIKTALSSPTSNVLVHCAMGLSRSSSLVLAYLMIDKNLTLVDAIKAVAANRNICPNAGFLEQLRDLDKQLHYQARRQ
ncbi:dual specificity protein phosphatase 13 isoform X2 [Oncorhynchus kisutch]|uniref:dual specificity protein phosphatase 13 isoform X2 n=1 Tax=Oncorhynchus kisutch TaxID=8019 RepID=UPI0009A01CBF|nr:dual specificity protein phosphatase 13 isoform X2 [Oncorhynchus kisutch]